MSNIRVRAARPEDFPQWRLLYRGYAAFYKADQTEEAVALTWSWVTDPGHEVDALVAEDVDGQLIGLAHYRPFARPLSATTGCFLDDLFVAPERRGSGVADMLLIRLSELAAQRGWSVVRWITADDNHRARAKYDQLATRTMWITYDMKPVQ
ncbi:GNAT family N-acetyltransferase [Intrasporangium calvum]|uniref:GNAT family N-acetyltransferase n=1 Tax=Intrasporangium calvum TaxID=53358 RepID=UPI000DF5DCE1|nr:GNAT family N-acetyltransferase [Intrasporangium calvum]AXG14538.1 GNAT family N-acetyltransferase [Intrasporangium calvum]